LRQGIIPLLWFISTKTSNHVAKRSISHLRLAIYLWMCCTATLQGSTEKLL
jgi:hypothetical protein